VKLAVDAFVLLTAVTMTAVSPIWATAQPSVNLASFPVEIFSVRLDTKFIYNHSVKNISFNT